MLLCGIRNRNTLWKRVRGGILPEPRYFLPRQPRWVLGEVLDTLAEREAHFARRPGSRGATGEGGVEAAALDLVGEVLERLGIRR